MKVFVITGLIGSNSELESYIKKYYAEENFLFLGDGNWLIADEDSKSPADIFSKLSQDNQSGPWPTNLIVPVEQYYGVQNTKVWDWLGSKGL